MSVAVGFVNSTGGFLAAESRISFDGESPIDTAKERKIYRLTGNRLFAFVGLCRLEKIVIDLLNQCYLPSEVAVKKWPRGNYGGILLTPDKRIFRLDDDGAFTELATPCMLVAGTGREYTIGALRGMGMKTKWRVETVPVSRMRTMAKRAIQVACDEHPQCGGAIHIANLKTI